MAEAGTPRSDFYSRGRALPQRTLLLCGRGATPVSVCPWLRRARHTGPGRAPAAQQVREAAGGNLRLHARARGEHEGMRE